MGRFPSREIDAKDAIRSGRKRDRAVAASLERAIRVLTLCAAFSKLTGLLFSRHRIIQSMMSRIGIIFEYSKPRFSKNAWDSWLMRSVSRVIRLKCFFLANSTTYSKSIVP